MWIVPDTGQAHARGSHFGTPCYFPEIHGVQSFFTDHSLMYVRDKDMNVELRAQVDPRDLPRNWFCSCNPLTNHTNQLWSSTGRNQILRIKFTGSRVTTGTLEIFPFLSEASQYSIAFITTQHTHWVLPKVQLHWGEIKFWGLKWLFGRGHTESWLRFGQYHHSVFKCCKAIFTKSSIQLAKRNPILRVKFKHGGSWAGCQDHGRDLVVRYQLLASSEALIFKSGFTTHERFSNWIEDTQSTLELPAWDLRLSRKLL